MTTDILSRLIKPAPAERRMRRVKRWQIRACERSSRRLYVYGDARKIVARLLKRGVDAYMAPLMVTVPVDTGESEP